MLTPSPLKKSLVANALENEIRSGVLLPGDRLPSMRAMAERFRVSTMVLQQAAEILEKKGLLTRDSRRGLFVADGALREKRLVVGLLTTIAPNLMDGYYEGLFQALNSIGGVAIPVYAGKTEDVRNMLAQKPSRVVMDLDAYHSYSLPELREILGGVPGTFFNRFEWEAPPPENGYLLDYVGLTVRAIRHLQSRGHRKIVFLSHHHEPRPFKMRQLKRAGEILNLEFGSPEFSWCGRFDLEYDFEHVQKLFGGKGGASAIFSRSDALLFEFMTKLEVCLPKTAALERLGCFNSLWSRIPGREFSTFAPDWAAAWKHMLTRKVNDLEWFSADLIPRQSERSGKSIN